MFLDIEEAFDIAFFASNITASFENDANEEN
jgi:hypothetical protein